MLVVVVCSCPGGNSCVSEYLSCVFLCFLSLLYLFFPVFVFYELENLGIQ